MKDSFLYNEINLVFILDKYYIENIIWCFSIWFLFLSEISNYICRLNKYRNINQHKKHCTENENLNNWFWNKKSYSTSSDVFLKSNIFGIMQKLMWLTLPIFLFTDWAIVIWNKRVFLWQSHSILCTLSPFKCFYKYKRGGTRTWPEWHTQIIRLNFSIKLL